MNTNKDGSAMSDEQLFDIAVANGHDAQKLRELEVALHNRRLFRSKLLQITSEARFSMFCGGELDLSNIKQIPDITEGENHD